MLSMVPKEEKLDFMRQWVGFYVCQKDDKKSERLFGNQKTDT